MYREVMRARWGAQRQLDGNELPQLRGDAIVRPSRSVARLLEGVKLMKVNAEPPSRLSDSRARAKEEIPIQLFFFQLWAGRQKLMT